MGLVITFTVKTMWCQVQLDQEAKIADLWGEATCAAHVTIRKAHVCTQVMSAGRWEWQICLVGHQACKYGGSSGAQSDIERALLGQHTNDLHC